MKLLIVHSESGDDYHFMVNEEFTTEEWYNYVKENYPDEIDEHGYNCFENVEYIDINNIKIIK